MIRVLLWIQDILQINLGLAMDVVRFRGHLGVGRRCCRYRRVGLPLWGEVFVVVIRISRNNDDLEIERRLEGRRKRSVGTSDP